MSETILIGFLTWLMFIFVILFIFDKYLGVSKSKEYRRTLADMYVVGKIKQIAKIDNIDLNAEFLEFAKVTKNKKIDFEALDTTIERELQEKLADKGKASTPKTITPKE